jgi:hypothetical protein
MYEYLSRVAWTDIGNAMVSGEMSTAKVMSPPRGTLPSSPSALVLVVGHLGDTIPLPMQFFKSWDVSTIIVLITTTA